LRGTEIPISVGWLRNPRYAGAYLKLFSGILKLLLTLHVISQIAISEPPDIRSILVPPPSDISAYDRKFSSLPVPTQMKLLIHGLRTAPLHPFIWGVNIIDATDSRNIVPMKRYFFRDSESQDFQLEKFHMEFAFKKTKIKSMKNSPRLMTPLLDIEFGGVYRREDGAESPAVDTSYVLRISASPLFQSGIWFRSRTKYLLLAPAGTPRVPSGKLLRLDVKASKEKTSVYLDNSPFAELSGDFRKGLLNLRTDWRPLSASVLEVHGTHFDGNLRIPVNESGLVSAE